MIDLDAFCRPYAYRDQQYWRSEQVSEIIKRAAKVKAIIRNNREVPFTSFISVLPPPLALLTNPDIEDSDSVTSPLLSPRLITLTHLCLIGIYGRQNFNRAINLRLPFLIYLEMSIHDSAGTADQSSRAFSTWNLPSLSSLSIIGYCTSIIKQDIDALISNHAPQITTLMLFIECMDTSHQDWRPYLMNKDAEFFNSLSRLSVLGIHISWFYRALHLPPLVYPSLQRRRPLSLYICEPQTPPFGEVAIANQRAFLAVGNLLMWGTSVNHAIGEVVFSHSWRRIASNLTNKNYNIESQKMFYEGLLKAGVAVKDRDGIGLQDGNGKLFMAGFESWTF